jgi:hypothetical protein
VYQCKCWFALASGYDWSILGGEGKVTWTVIANKSGVEKQKRILYRAEIFLGEFSHCGYKFFLKKLGKKIYKCEFEKKMIKKWKYLTIFSNHKIGKKKGKKKHQYRGIYMCAL